MSCLPALKPSIFGYFSPIGIIAALVQPPLPGKQCCRVKASEQVSFLKARRGQTHFKQFYFCCHVGSKLLD